MRSRLKTQFTIVSFFVLLNLIVGRLFHESLNLVCVSELFIIALSSFIFWRSTFPLIKKSVKKWNPLNNRKSLIIQSGIGITSSLINILLSYVFIVLLMVYVYKCTSPSFSLINASLANNIAINLFCYFSLALFFLHKSKQEIDSTNQKTISNKSDKIVLSSGNRQYLIDLNDIRFIEASNNCIVIHTDSGKFVKYQSLKSFLLEFNTNNLKRVHRSFAVNINHINSIKKNKNGDGIITLQDEHQVKLSRNYQLQLLN